MRAVRSRPQRWLPPLALVPWAAVVSGCWQPTGAAAEIQIGVPDELIGLEFEPLQPGGDIPLETFGQGGTHAALAIRCYGLGDRAFVDVTLRNLDGEGEVMSFPSLTPSLLVCREGPCDLIPMNVMTGGLADPEDKEGLHIEVEATAHNEYGVSASATTDGFLRRR